MFNVFIAMLYNNKDKRWHPIMFNESPLPGPPSDDKPVRHKSKGHHTAGFDNRADAIKSTAELAVKLEQETGMPPTLVVDTDIQWSGEEVPAIVAFFVKDGDAWKIAF